MQAAIAVRKARESDIPAIVTLLDALNRTEGNVVAPVEAAPLCAALFGASAEVKLQCLVAEMADAVVGTLLHYPGYDTLSASVGYHLADMVVDEGQRRSGIGRALMQALAAQTLGEGKSWVSLTALKSNHAARAFYTSLGMTQVEVDFFAVGKQGVKKIIVGL